MFCRALGSGIIFAIFILDIAESFCKITPGNKSLVPSSLGVILVLNCSSASSRVNFVNASWTRNGTPIEKTSTRENKGKTWIAAWLTNTSSVQEGEKFECKISYPELFGGGTVKCGVSPGKPSLRKLQHAKIFNRVVLTDLREDFVCAVERGWPIPTLSWWRNGLQIHHKDFYETYYVDLSPDRKELTLTVVFIRGAHHGKYTCRAENMFGNFTETTRLLVNRYKMVKWHSDLKLSPIVALEGQNITLECTCSEDECLEKTARSYWRFQDNDVARTARVRLSHVITEKTLRILMIIRNVSRLDNGSYLCGINTSKGFDEVITRLHVVSKDLRPRILVNKRKVFASVGSQALLKCSAQYPSVLHYTPDPFWSRDDKQIPSQHIHYVQKQFIPKNSPKSTEILTFQLTILNVSHEDYYVSYSCGVVVNVGRARVRFFEELGLAPLRDRVDEVGEEESKTEVEGNSLITISFIAAGSAISGFIMGVIFLVYKRCRSQRYIDDLFFETAVVDQQFQYDVFVTFSSQDSNWIKKALIPLLDNHEINYCIHYNDFEIGKPVIDNVTQSVYTSRKVLIVMSHNYISSEFCRGELEIALYRCATMGDPCVIAIRIDDIDRSNLPKALRNRTFLDYYDLIERKTWQERLIKHLKPPPMENNLKQNSQVLHSLLQNAKK